jgi:hypothetical protein
MPYSECNRLENSQGLVEAFQKPAMLFRYINMLIVILFIQSNGGFIGSAGSRSHWLCLPSSPE